METLAPAKRSIESDDIASLASKRLRIDNKQTDSQTKDANHRPKNNQAPLRLLSLDGGGVRGLSSIAILKRIMEGINEGRAAEEMLHPYQVFDMMGGTSTGGIIAVMLGRLQMSLEDCEDAYINLSRKIFTTKRSNLNLPARAKDFLYASAKFDTAGLEKAIQECIQARGFPRDELLKDPDSQCKTFVVATQKSDTEPEIFRSYENFHQPQPLYPECKIWQACRATSAAPTFFDKVEIGKYRQKFWDGALCYNNPVQQVKLEANAVWPDRDVQLISLGTGSAPGPAFEGKLHEIARIMSKLVTETEKTAREFHENNSKMESLGLYYRFNVTYGLDTIGLEEHAHIEKIADFTNTYLKHHEVRDKLEKCVRSLREDWSEGNS